MIAGCIYCDLGERARLLGEAKAAPAADGGFNTRFGVGECGVLLRLLFLRGATSAAATLPTAACPAAAAGGGFNTRLGVRECGALTPVVLALVCLDAPAQIALPPPSVMLKPLYKYNLLKGAVILQRTIRSECVCIRAAALHHVHRGA